MHCAGWGAKGAMRYLLYENWGGLEPSASLAVSFFHFPKECSGKRPSNGLNIYLHEVMARVHTQLCRLYI